MKIVSMSRIGIGILLFVLSFPLVLRAQHIQVDYDKVKDRTIVKTDEMEVYKNGDTSLSFKTYYICKGNVENCHPLYLVSCSLRIQRTGVITERLAR